MTYAIFIKPTRERPSAHAEESRPCFSLTYVLFVSERDGSPWRGTFLRSPLSRVSATGAGHPPEGEREGAPLRVAGSAHARATRASALRGPRGPYPLGIYPDFYIADKVLATLGEGTFGKVVKVKDLQM